MHETSEVSSAVPPGTAGSDSGSASTPTTRAGAFRIVGYERVLPASRRDAFAAILRAIELLRYPRIAADAEACEVRFSALAGIVVARAIEATPESSTLRVELTSLRGAAGGRSAVVILPGLLLGGAVRAAERYFASGFLDNVARVVAGRAVGRDSARLPLVAALRERLEIVGE